MKVTILIITLTIIGYTFSGYCSEKAILESNRLPTEYTYDDRKLAYNEIASCASLRTTSSTTADEKACCYLKVKFRNKEADKKFTHRGCIALTISEMSDIDKTIDDLEDKIEEPENIEKADIDIDCSSKYLKLAGLILLSFLL